MSSATTEMLESRLAGRLAGRLARHVQAPRASWAAQVVSWMDLVDLCRELDDCLLAVETPSADALSLHDAVLTLAIGCGTWLIHEVRTSKADISPSGETPGTLQASLELLRILHRSRHAPFAVDELETARQRIFNAAA